MKAVGIVAEYNPLHNGHIYHIQETKRLAGTDAVVIAMSGNYVQRGEPAILDKWSRAEAAVRHGADLVVEIPVLYCLSDAGKYAEAGVEILRSLGCVDRLSFGCECDDPVSLKRVAERLASNTSAIAERIAEYSSEGNNYPAARALAYGSLFAGDEYHDKDLEILNGSNNILGLEYLRACGDMEPLIIKRLGASYNSDIVADAVYQSASGIRKMIREGEDISGYVPEATLSCLKKKHVSDNDEWLKVLKYAVLSSSPQQIEDCPSGGEGLAYRVREAVIESQTWDELIHHVKTKKYTYTRISRLLMQIILGICNEKHADIRPSYIRVLAFNDRGRALLSEMRDEETNSLPIITRVGRDSRCLGDKGLTLERLDVLADDVYNLVSGRDMYSESAHRKHPLVL